MVSPYNEMCSLYNEWSIANVYYPMPSHFERNMFARSMEMTGHVLLAIVNFVGLRAIAASAAFAVRSTSRSQRHAGAYVALTVVALVGSSARLQVMSQTAFAAINASSDDQLQDFYLQFLDYVDDAQIKWIKCGYLRRLSAAGSTVVRCQSAPLDGVISGSAGFPALRTHKKSLFVVSYPWLSKHHPDPDGSTL
ncbi:unnamed protein product [Prorocentrum cordatum]|uniref:Uncharacterized protein n=1 Tax=Prorocentrum cordatum TaxID=2364126 RepID=A0ABN9PQM7_9DINO|nr:unnamed protein product [Polarella glacialis]